MVLQTLSSAGQTHPLYNVTGLFGKMFRCKSVFLNKNLSMKNDEKMLFLTI